MAVSNIGGPSDPGGVTAQNALARWLARQKQAQTQFSAAEQPLRQAVQSFQPGGGYGQSQAMLLRDEARRAGAEATAQQVATGMSSGSLATSTGLRVGRDLATGLAGVEDVRTQFLGQALRDLSGLRAGHAQTTAATVDPTYAPYMGYLGGRAGQETQLELGEMGAKAEAARLTEAKRQFTQSWYDRQRERTDETQRQREAIKATQERQKQLDWQARQTSQPRFQIGSR